MRDYTLFIPEFIAAGGAIVVIGLELWWPNIRKDLLAYLTAAFALALAWPWASTWALAVASSRVAVMREYCCSIGATKVAAVAKSMPIIEPTTSIPPR